MNIQMNSPLSSLNSPINSMNLSNNYGSPTSGGGSGGSPGGGGGVDTKMFLSHGGRPTKGNGRKRKGVDEYAAENRVDFTSRSIVRDGQLVRILVCRFCCQSIGARSDRIKEHLASKRHQKLKMEAFREAAEAGRDLSQEYSDDSVSGLLPEPPITMLKFPGKALAHLLEGDGGGGRHTSRELTPEGEDRKPVIPTPPPLKDHRIGSPPPQSLQHTPMHSGVPGNANIRGNGGPTSSTNTPPPKSESVPQQLLCVRWGNYDSNIVSMFSKLRSQEHFVDVTLWCEGRTIKCHKMVLSACSTYFEQLLTETPNVHPIIFLKDMKFWEIEALVEFMYKGETSIHQDKLQSLLRAAESLQIKGLGSPPNSGGAPAPNNTSSPSNSTLQSSRDVSGSHNNLSSNDEEHSNSMDMSTNRMNNHHGNPSVLGQNKQSMNMGIDLSNHSSNSINHNFQNSSNVPGLNNLYPLSLAGGGSQINNPIPAKRRKKETPRRIESLPRIAHSHPGLTLPLPLLPALYNSQVMQSENAIDDEDSGSEDELIIQEKNHIDIKPEHDMNYDDSNDGDGPENYADQNQSRQSMDEDDESNGGQVDRNQEMCENHDQGLAGTMGLIGLTDLRIGISNSLGNLISSERDGERERSRKGNPIKKIHIGNNNNNNDTTSSPGIPSLIHNAAMD